MPIFDFHCEECGHEFEALVLGQKEQVRCPHCKSNNVKKAISMFSCTGLQLDKRLKLDSIEKMRQGEAWVKKQKFRKNRIKIL